MDRRQDEERGGKGVRKVGGEKGRGQKKKRNRGTISGKYIKGGDVRGVKKRCREKK